MNRDYSDLRANYLKDELLLDQCSEDPIQQFVTWFEEVQQSKEEEPNAMVFCTVDRNGCPDARTLLLKEVWNKRFVFYSNYESNKAIQIDNNNRCSIVFLWLSLERQIRIKGSVQKLSEEKSLQYFQSRPRGSQIGAWASPQSREISRDNLEESVMSFTKKFEQSEDIPLPPHWGGYEVDPVEIEFWQGRSSRLHDRIVYSKTDGTWSRKRLAP